MRVIQRITNVRREQGAPAAHPLALILLGYLILSVGLSLALPLGEAADEVSHRAYVDEIARNGRLPAVSGLAAGEALQPPLYYALVAGLTRWRPLSDLRVAANPDYSPDKAFPPNLLLHPRAESFPYHGDALAWHVMRLISCLMGVVTIWATYRLAQATVPGDTAVPTAAAGLVAFLPGFVLLSAAINNDNLITALGALATWQWLRMMKNPPRLADGVILGTLLGLSALTKLSGLPLAVFSAGLYVYWIWRRGQRRRWLLSGVVCGAVFVALAGSLAVINTRRFGDPLAWSQLAATWPRAAAMTLADWQRYALSMYTSFWGRFGGASQIWLPTAVYILLAVTPILALIGLGRVAQDCRAGRTSSFTGHALLLFAAFDVALVLSHMRTSAAVTGMDLARNVFAGLAALAVLIAVGVTRLWPQRRQAVAVALVAIMCACSVLTAGIVVRTYRAPASAAGTVAGSSEPSPPQTLPGTIGHRLPLCIGCQAADFGGKIQLLSYEVQIEPIRDGQKGDGTPGDGTRVLVTASWQSTAPVDQVYWLLLRVLSGAEVVATVEGVPGAGLPTTDRWRPGQVYTSQHSITLPSSVPPGSYSVDVGLHPAGAWQWLSVGGQDTLPLGQVEVK